MSEHERVSKKQKTKEKLHILRTKAEDVIKRLRKDVEKAVHEISEKVRIFIYISFFSDFDIIMTKSGTIMNVA